MHQGPHLSTRNFAKIIGADFKFTGWSFKTLEFHKVPKIVQKIFNLPIILMNFICLFRRAFSLPSYDIYLCEGFTPSIAAVINKTFINRRSTIITLAIGLPVYWNRYFFKKIYSHIDGVICVSNLCKEFIKKYANCPIRIVHPYIREDRYRELEKIDPNLENYIIISIGSGTYIKGMDILVEAFKIVKREIKKAELYIIGKPHPKEWRKIKGVHIKGYVENITPYLRKASLYVQSSRSDAFPIASIEALRAGIPALVTDTVGTKEIVEKLDKNLIRKISSKDLAEGILYYFNLPFHLKRELSREAKKLSTSFCTEEACHVFLEEFSALIRQIKN